MIVSLSGQGKEQEEQENPGVVYQIFQLTTGKIIAKNNGVGFMTDEGLIVELIDPCEIQYMQSPQGLMINFLPLGMFTGQTRLSVNSNDIIWENEVKESMIDSYKKALQDFKLKGGKTEESDIIIAEKIILK